MEKFLETATQIFTIVAALAAFGFVVAVATVSLIGPKLSHLFQGLPF